MSLFRQLEIEDRGGSSHGLTDGTNPVEIVPAPADGFTRVVECLRFVNLDSGAVDIHVRKTVGASDYEFDAALALATGQPYLPIEGPDIVRLTDEDQSITVVLGGSVSSDEPSWIASWRDVPVAT